MTLQTALDHLAAFEAESHRLVPDMAIRIRLRLEARVAELGGAVLVFDEGAADELVFPLEGDLMIGRSKECDVRVRDDGRASRLHCRLTTRGGLWFVEDLRSANGTLVNGELIEPAEPRRLWGGEELIVGHTFVRFRLASKRG